ncbi:hypothetical protein F511_28388 [Dorcoceras hygrometricum]|uniref:Dystroglycan-like n=1 Tax=Dorcoceras hygrometricum TaxID=472368 RepID=A0A2Z7B1B5_9LAMI|nr:hypothetical protein F511_28388 [Dorcoceras hygrometricum]
MASYLISSSLHIAFDSIFDMDDAGLVQMFESFIVTGLKEFLGCPAVFYEAALAEFFENGSVRDGMVVSTIGGTTVEISEEIFAVEFELPMEGLTDLSEVPKYLVFDARSLFFETKEQVGISCLKREMKIEYHLLSDILAKTIYVKAGSFDAVTRERFFLMTVITFDVKVNWRRLLFDILKDMVTPGSRQAKGGSNDESRVKKAPKTKAASKKRPEDVVATKPVVKKKRATKQKPVNESVVEQVAESTANKETVVENIVEKIDEPVSLPTEVKVVNEGISTTDDVDVIIEQILAETAKIGTDEDDQDAGTSDVGDKTAETADREKHWFDLSYEEIIVQMTERPVVTPSDTDEEMGTNVGVQTESCQYDSFVEEPLEGAEQVNEMEMGEAEQSMGERTDADEAMSLEDILMTIPADVPLPSAGVEITKITLGKDIKIQGVDERTWYMASLPRIPVDDKGKEPLQEKDPVKGKPPKELFSLILADIECLVQLRDQIIDDVEQFFNSFSIKKLAHLKIDESYFHKEELVLSWGEAESTRVALNRRFILEDLKEQTMAHGLKWKKTCCSNIFEGRPRDPGAIIARSNTNFPSKCWIRTKTMVDGSLVIQEGTDMWETIPRTIASFTFEVSRQRSYNDTLPPMSDFFKLMKKRWGDVCIEVAQFFASGKLLPAGSEDFCRSISVVEPVSSFASRQPTVLSFRLSQFCTIFCSVQFIQWVEYS